MIAAAPEIPSSTSKYSARFLVLIATRSIR
jgi:hypothetical protein